ncbi:unnamed protein product, partial [Heterosigma akashiwo]
GVRAGVGGVAGDEGRPGVGALGLARPSTKRPRGRQRPLRRPVQSCSFLDRHWNDSMWICIGCIRLDTLSCFNCSTPTIVIVVGGTRYI